MKKKFTFLIAALMLLTMISQPTRLWGQERTTPTTSDFTWPTPYLSEDFNSLSATSGTGNTTSATTLTSQTSFGIFDKIYCGKGVNTWAIENNNTFGSNVFKLSSKSTKYLIASVTGKSFENKGAFSVKIAKTDKCYFGLYANDENNLVNKAYASVYLQNNNGALSIHSGSGWVSIGSYSGDIIEIHVIYNNTTSADTYGDEITLAAKTAHVYVNGNCVMNSSTPKAFTIPGTSLTLFRGCPINANGNNCTIDDVKIYNSLPTAATPTQVATPEIILAGGTYTGNQTTTITCGTAGASIYYTLDGSVPTTSSTAYSSSVTIDHSCTLKAKAFKDGLTDSDVASTTYTIKMATPSFSPAGGTYDATQSVTLSSTAGATIYYTLDGTTPTTSSTEYSSAISVSSTKTIKALAVKANCNNSDIGSATYTLKAQTPTFSPAAGTYLGTQTVSINCTTADVTIYYTTNGDIPTTNSSVYSSAISVSSSQTLKAIAVKSGLENSSVGSAEYTINHPLTTMDAIFEASASAGSYYVTFNNWVVTGVNGNQVFVTDGTKGFIIYKSGHGFSVGNIISGTTTNATALTRFKGSAEFTALTSSTSDLTVTTGGTVTPQVVTIGDLSGVNTGSVITLNGLTYNSTDGVLSDGDHTITPYTSLYTGTFTNGTIYNITGVYQQYGDDEPHNILPRSSADIVEVHDPAITTSPATALSVPDYIKGTPESGIDTEILTVNGTYLTADVTVALENDASSDFEMSTDLETWGHSITLNQSNGSVTNAEIAVRLKVGESVADYSDRIVLSSTNATTKYVNVTGSVTYAHVTYNGNGSDGGAVPTDETYTYNQQVTVAGQGTMTRTGYEFIGWNTESDGTGDEYEEGDTFNITEDVTLYAQWDAATWTLTAASVAHGSISFTVGGVASSTSAKTGETVTIVPTPDSGYGMSSFSINGGSAQTGTTFTMPAANVTVTATFTPMVTDELTPSLLDLSGTSYTSWSDVESQSEAVYAGQSYPNEEAIQLRTKNSESGIITTASGGKAKKVTITWYSSTESTLFVYGKNSAYESPADLYSGTSAEHGAAGTKLGSIAYNSSGAELEINNDTVTYIGLRSSSGAIYMTKIEITWAAPTYALAYDANGGTGSMTDPSSPYIYNTSVTVLAKANTITAPSGKMFSKWNARSDGTGKDYAPVDTLKMPKHNKTLYAIWEDECNETATMAATTGTKEYVNDAGELSFKINLSSKVTALSGCAAITEYGFVYSTNGTTPTVGGANCTKIVKGTEYTTANTVFEHELTSATLGATYKICSYATNLAGTAYGTEVTVPIDADYPSYTISYSTNGTSEASTTKIYQGNAISDLITPTPSNVPAGYTFRGWYNGDYALNNSAPIFVKNGDAITADLELKAVFAIGTTSEGEFTKSYGFETASDDDWTIDGPARDNTKPNTGSYAGKINTNNTYVTFNNKVKVKEFSFAFTRASNNNNYNVYIETKTDNTAWAAAETYAMSGFNDDGTYQTRTKTFDGTTELYVRFHCSNTTAVRYVDDVTITYDAETTTYSNFCTSVSLIDLTEDVTIDGDLNVTSYTLTIPSGKTLTVNGTLTNNIAANLVIKDGGQLKFYDNGAKDGVQATVEKNISAWPTTKPADGWYFIASPVNAANYNPSSAGLITDDFLGDQGTTSTRTYDFYYLAYENDKPMWKNYRKATFNMANGQGYLYANANDQTLAFAGAIKPYDAGYTIPVTEGWNLVGNPYTFNAYANRRYYKIDPSSTIIEPVADNEAVPPCTGIIVNTEDSGASVTFTDTQSGTSYVNQGNLQMVLAQNVATRSEGTAQTLDKAIVSFNEGSQLGKFYFGTQDANLYIPQDNEEYAIVSSSAQGEMPVNFKAHRDGQYTITVNPEEVEMGYLHLVDNIAGTDVDLLANPSYTFNAKADDYESRFRLVFSTTMVNADMGDDFAFISNGQLVIANEGEAILQVIDVTGRVVATESVNGTCSKAVNVKAGVYVLRLINGTDVKTQKIIVK